MNNRKLLQINTVINSGSTGRIAEEIGQIAIQNEWKSFIAFGRNERQSESQKIKIGNNLDIKLHGLRTRFLDQHGFGSRKATQNFIKIIDSINPDIIHLHNLHGYYLNIDVFFNYLATRNHPIVWTLHDCWPITGHCPYFTYVDCDKWKTHCSHCPQKNKYPASLYIDNSYNNFDKKRQLFTLPKDMILVPVSKWLEGIVKDSFLSVYSTEVIHNGIDLDIFKPTQNQVLSKKYKHDNHFIILGVANVWEDRKGLRDFIELALKLPSNFRIILVGLNKKQIKNLPPNIYGVERTENVSELAALYTLANVFVNPTWEDNFPTTHLEAMACGTPVITYNTGGSPESITPETGFVIEKGNIDKMIQSILYIKLQGENYYQEACRKLVSNNYYKNNQFNKYISLYNKMLNK